MNDNIIIRTISKIHFILLSALSFIILSLFALFIILQNGLYLEEISLQNIKVKKLYIKWDEKISLSANEVNIIEDKHEQSSTEDYEKILKTIKTILPFTSWLKELDIYTILLNDIEGSIKYIDDKEGYIKLASENFTLNSSILPSNGLLYLELNEFKALNNRVIIDGNAVLNAKEMGFETSLNILLHDDTKLNLFAHGDTKRLSYELKSKDNIHNTKEIVDLFDLNAEIKYWVYDALDMSSLSLESFYGWIEYKNIDKAFLNLHAKATANDSIYRYDEKLAAVSSAETQLEFKNGVLYIRPKNGYSYNFFLDKSWLKIDFSKDEEILTLQLLFKAQVNKDILSLLERYKIELPFIQNRGHIDTDLKLEINLRTLDVEADGLFYAKDAEIKYLGLDIDILEAAVYLKNTHVKVDNMSAKYKNIASANVDLEFNAKKSSGKLTFEFDKISSDDGALSLINKRKPLTATYTISADGDYLFIDKSSWGYKEKIFNLSAIKTPFDIKTLKARIPTTSIISPKLGSASLYGDISFKSGKAAFNIELLKLYDNNIKLNKPMPSFDLIYENKNISLSSKKTISFDINKKNATLENIMFNIKDGSLKAKDIYLKFDDIFKAKIALDYNLSSSYGTVTLQESEVKNDAFGEVFKTDKKVELFIQQKSNQTTIGSNDYDFEFLNDNSGWVANIKSLEKIYEESKVLKKYDLTNGSLKIEKKLNQESIDFSLQSDFRYKFLTTIDEPIENYLINGKYNIDTKNIDLTINNSVDIKIEDDIKISANNAGINIKEIINFFDQREDVNDSNKDITLFFEAKNSYLFLAKNRRIISDRITLKYINKAISAELLHNRGRAVFSLDKDKLYLYGDEFNDEFMDKLFALSKFKGGSFEFFINGSIKEYDGMAHIKNTTILDYKILNNILAFVNTVPSLVTFSLPGYNKNGIAAEETYINFKLKDEIYKMSDIYLKSKEIEIVGLGEASIEKNSINLDLNLKTDLGSSISKIPLVGYILLGKENISTSLKVTGKLDDPDVTTQVAKDIAVAPFNIIKRTFMYPFELFKIDDKKSE